MLATNEDQYHPAEQYPCRISKDSYTWPIPPPFHHIPLGFRLGVLKMTGEGLHSITLFLLGLPVQIMLKRNFAAEVFTCEYGKVFSLMKVHEE